jgi:hypothetical protein
MLFCQLFAPLAMGCAFQSDRHAAHHEGQVFECWRKPLRSTSRVAGNAISGKPKFKGGDADLARSKVKRLQGV